MRLDSGRNVYIKRYSGGNGTKRISGRDTLCARRSDLVVDGEKDRRFRDKSTVSRNPGMRESLDKTESDRDRWHIQTCPTLCCACICDPLRNFSDPGHPSFRSFQAATGRVLVRELFETRCDAHLTLISRQRAEIPGAIAGRSQKTPPSGVFLARLGKSLEKKIFSR